MKRHISCNQKFWFPKELHCSSTFSIVWILTCFVVDVNLAQQLELGMDCLLSDLEQTQLSSSCPVGQSRWPSHTNWGAMHWEFVLHTKKPLWQWKGSLLTLPALDSTEMMCVAYPLWPVRATNIQLTLIQSECLMSPITLAVQMKPWISYGWILVSAWAIEKCLQGVSSSGCENVTVTFCCRCHSFHWK